MSCEKDRLARAGLNRATALIAKNRRFEGRLCRGQWAALRIVLPHDHKSFYYCAGYFTVQP
jgi:hypothetical protein